MNHIHTKRKIGNAGVIAGIFSIALAVFVVMYLSVYILPLSDNSFSYGIITLTLIFLGLAGPYLMLKLIAHEAHSRNREEKELQLKDIPKDQHQLDDGKTP